MLGVGNQYLFQWRLQKNKFGLLSAGSDDYVMIKKYGAAWVRPHPGPFLWDAIQKSKTGGYTFTNTDNIVKKYHQQNIAILATIFPFADWDQKSRSDFAKCKVSDWDEFLPKNDIKGRDSYLPQYRCNPKDWNAYTQWVKAVVERYDGDGVNDMSGLTQPIKYWEVMNEPDLDGGERLDFYKEDATAYAELLIRTAQAIRAADSSAKILIAGAAGGDSRFLNFYRQVFQNENTLTAFDIGNVRSISNDEYQNFNVAPYKKLLAEFKLSKPIWVTEAEAIVSKDDQTNRSQTIASGKQALQLGAEKIFFTRYEYADAILEIK